MVTASFLKFKFIHSSNQLEQTENCKSRYGINSHTQHTNVLQHSVFLTRIRPLLVIQNWRSSNSLCSHCTVRILEGNLSCEVTHYKTKIKVWFSLVHSHGQVPPRPEGLSTLHILVRVCVEDCLLLPHHADGSPSHPGRLRRPRWKPLQHVWRIFLTTDNQCHRSTYDVYGYRGKKFFVWRSSSNRKDNVKRKEKCYRRRLYWCGSEQIQIADRCEGSNDPSGTTLTM